MKKFLSMVLALVMAMSLVTISAGAKDFTDDSKVNYAEAVDVISALGIVDGYTDGSFRPTTELNRAQAAKIICNMVLGPTTASALSASAAPFSDVPADHWAAGYIAYCAKEGIIAGMGDGTFHPADTLTGYAFMKMLLTAIGYDAEMEGFVGANWGVNVAKQAIGIDLDDGNDEFVGTAKVTREEACLYAFNALTATMVKYGSKTTVNVNGATVVVGGSEATDVDGRGYKNYKTGAAQDDKDTLEFCEKYFPNLRLNDGDKDDFGRPANTWKIKSKEVGTYAKTPALTYTKDVDGDDLYDDLGEPSMKADGKTTKYVINGEPQENVKVDDSKKTFGDNGVLTEVFTEEDDDEVKVTIVEIETFIDEIVDVDENDDDERVVVVDGMEYVTEEFEEDDMVLYTKAMNKDGDYEIQSMVLAEKKTGEYTKKVGDKYTVDGEVYELSKNGTNTAAVKDDVDFYLDAYGYIIKMDTADESTSVDNLAYVLKAGESRGEGWAKLLFADGTTKTVDTDEVYDEDIIVSFKEDDGVYELKDKTTGTKPASDFDKGNTKMGGVRVDSKTVFVYMVDDGDDVTYKAYTSFKKAPGFDTATITYYAKDSVANVVYVAVDDTDLASSSDALIFLAAQKDLDVNDDGDAEWYEFQAIVDGKITTLNVLTDAEGLDALVDGVMVYESATFNADDMVKKFEAPDAGAYTVVTKCEKESNEVIILGDDDYAFADDVKVFVVDDDEIAAGSISTIREDDMENKDDETGTKNPYASIYFTLNDDGDVDTIVLVKA